MLKGDKGEDGKDGEDGDSWFKAVSKDESYFSLTLLDGSVIRLPLYNLAIEFYYEGLIIDGPMFVSGAESRTISYKIQSVENPKVSVLASNGWTAIITRTSEREGEISIKAPYPYVQSDLVVIVSDGQKTIMEYVEFTDVPVPVGSVTLNRSDVEMWLEEPSSCRVSLTAEILPVNASDKNVTWTSSDATKVAVSSTGVVTAVAEGTAVITAATQNGPSASCTVSVKTRYSGVSVGDYVYPDGTFGTDPSGAIARVFYRGNPRKSDETLPGTAVSGLAVYTGYYSGKFSDDKAPWAIGFYSSAINNGYASPIESRGNSNTKAAFEYISAGSKVFNPFATLLEHRTSYPLPEGMSDWYLPSAEEMLMISEKEYHNVNTLYSDQGYYVSSLVGEPRYSYGYWMIDGMNASQAVLMYASKANAVDTDMYARYTYVFAF